MSPKLFALTYITVNNGSTRYFTLNHQHRKKTTLQTKEHLARFCTSKHPV